MDDNVRKLSLQHGSSLSRVHVKLRSFTVHSKLACMEFYWNGRLYLDVTVLHVRVFDRYEVQV